MTVEADHGVERLNKFLAAATAKELPFDEMLGLKAEAFEACAADSRARGEHELAEAEEAAAAHAWDAAAAARRAEGRTRERDVADVTPHEDRAQPTGLIDLVCGHRTANVQYANRGVVGLCPVCHSYQLSAWSAEAKREDRSDEEIAADFKARRGADQHE